MKRLIRLLFILLTAPLFLCSCNQDDDINEIFVSGVWYFNNYWTNVDWDSDNDRSARPVYHLPDDLNVIWSFQIAFEADGTFSGTLHGGASFSGRWEANPKGRTFAVIGPINTSGNISGKNKEFITMLKNAQFYKGDSKNMLQLAPESKTNCMQFSHRQLGL